MLSSETYRVLTHQQMSVLDQDLSKLEAAESKLVEELDDIRSKISNIRNQRAALASRIAAVWSLPNELLSYIFELGLTEQQAMLEANDKEEGYADEGGATPVKVGFHILVSQVCRMFRQVALCTPSLWGQIHVHGLLPRHLDYVRTCVDRSGSSHLDILLECENSYILDDEYEVNALSSFTAILAPHILRFKRLTVRLQGFPVLYRVMHALNRPAPLLETLELRDIDYEATFDENEPFFPPELRKPVTLFEGIVPKLSRVALDGVHIGWSTCNFKNLTDLQLGFHTFDVRPTYEEFKAIIDASPALQALSLGGSAPLLSEDLAESALYTPILMEQLTELTISDISSDYVATLISLLCAPNLKSLSLADMDTNDYSSLARRITGPPALFPTLAALKLAAIEVEDVACGDLLRAYSTLTNISLDMRRMTPAWLDVLEARGGEVVCPKLECLRCVGAPTSDIRRVLQSRSEAGFQVERLELDEESVGWTSTACMNWIRENAKVEIIVPSDHGSDDDNIDDTGSEWATDDGGFELSMDGLSDVDEVNEDGDEDDEDSGDDSDIEVDATESSESSHNSVE